VQIDVKFAMRDVQRSLGKLERGIKEKATVMAINKTISKGKTEMVRAITSEFNLKQAEVRPRLKLIKSRRGRLSAELNPFASARRGRSLNMIHFLEGKVTIAEMKRRKKKGNHKPLRFKIKKQGGAKIIKGAFIGNKGRTIFQRTTDARTPIKAVSTIDVPQMFTTRLINRRVIKRIQKEFPIEFERAARLVLRRFNK